MKWNKDGFLTPALLENKIETTEYARVCPFNPENGLDEDQLAVEFFPGETKFHPRIGTYIDTYVGFSKEFRETSSSGGIATYIFKELLSLKIVDHLFVVKEFHGSYKYQLFSNVDDIIKISKTRYLPVTLEELFLLIDSLKGKIAVSAVACFAKAIRLKQYHHPELKDKIPFIVGIICGGLKSKAYTDFLAQNAGIEHRYNNQEYRIKDPNDLALAYSFGA